ncbi:MAG: Sua5/YciO/YrdC/YwlC family protein, partial [Nitrospinales bacterium]|nr:Sua5/YciO/YrdC/YwlC family protein [Nitrospinales bacterium]
MELKKIHEILVNGGVIAYPTEAVFGLGCDPSNEQAITKILEIKKRTLEMGFVLLTPNIEIVSGWVNM